MNKRRSDTSNASVLEQLRDTFDTTQLLHWVDQWDEQCAALVDPEGLRADVLRLHAMAHAVINGGPISVTGTTPLAVGEQATELDMTLDGLITMLAHLRRGLQPLEALAPTGV